MIGLEQSLCLLLLTTTKPSQPPKHTSALFGLPMKGSVYIATTVDGKIAGPDGDVSFLDNYQSSELGDMGFADFLASIDVIIMGRKSFEKVMSFGQDMWPYGTTQVMVWSRNDVEIPDYLKQTVSCSKLPPRALFDQLKEQGRKNAYIDGGFTIQSFLNDGLINEMIITQVPLILGEGISLFGKTRRRVNLEHIKTQTYPNGLVKSSYLVKSEREK